jgi:hypothetical protein
MTQSTEPKNAEKTASKVEEDKATPPKHAKKATSKVKDETAPPTHAHKTHAHKTTSKVEENEATLSKGAKKTQSKECELALAVLKAKRVYWLCCWCFKRNYGGEPPYPCKCGRPVCQHCHNVEGIKFKGT